MPNPSTPPQLIANPWRQDVYPEYIVIYDANDVRIADVYAFPTADEDAEARSAAKLITAAPDLLECAQMLYLITAEGEVRDSERAEFHKLAADAIAKAA